MLPKNIIYFALGPIGAGVIGIITLPVVAWFFSQEDIGRMAMLQVAISFSTLFFSLGLDQAYVREFHDEGNKSALLKSTALPGVVLLSVSLALLLLTNGFLSNLLFEIQSFELSLLIALALFASLLSRFLSIVLRMYERGLAFSMSQLLPKVIMLLVIAFYLLYGAEKSLTNLLCANVTAISCVCLILIFNTREVWKEAIKEKVDTTKLVSMFKFGAPLIIAGIAYWGINSADRVLMKELSNLEELGLYSVAMNLAAAATILQSVFSTVWAPMVYKMASRDTREVIEKVHEVSRYMLFFVVLIFSLAGLFSFVLTYFLPDSYDSVRWIIISCLGCPLLYALSETTVVGIGLGKRTSLAMLAALIALVFNLVINWYLIPMFGAAGAAAATCLTFLIFFVLRTEFSYYLGLKIPRKTLYLSCSFVVFGAVVSTLYGKSLGIWLSVFWLMTLLALLKLFRGELSRSREFLVKAYKARTS